MKWLLFVVTVVNAHSFSSSSIGYTPNEVTACIATPACTRNRICTFGTEANYVLARNTLFAATGRSLSCADQCTCSANPRNLVATKLAAAVVDPAIYANNSLCSNQILKAAMYFQTGGYACETVFREAQTNLIRLCGMQNGRPCNGKCTDWYKIDRPPPPCEERQGVDDVSLLVGGLILFLGVTLWAWTSGIDFNYMHGKQRPISEYYQPTNTAFTDVYDYFLQNTKW